MKLRYSEFQDRIDIDAFEEAIGFVPISSSRGNDTGHCVFPENHAHGDSTGKFAIHRDKKVYNCVTGDTLVQHHHGYAFAGWLAKKPATTVLGSDGEYHVTRWQSFGVQDVYAVEFENGDIIKATADHRWLVSRTKGDPWCDDKRAWVTTVELQDRRVPLQTPNSFTYDEDDWAKGVIHGMCFGDGTLYMKGRYSKLPGFGREDRALIRRYGGKHISEYDHYERPTTVAYRLPAHYKVLPEVPTQDLYFINRSYVRGFIAGLIAADGHVPANASPLIYQANREVLEDLRYIAGWAGLPTTSIRMERQQNPWTGEESPIYCLTFIKEGFINDGEIDDHLILKPSHLRNAQDGHKDRKNTHTMRVTSVTKLSEPEEVYCCVEPTTMTWTTGLGYLTGNCWVCGGGSLLSLAMELYDFDVDTATQWLYQFTDDIDVVSPAEWEYRMLREMAEDTKERGNNMPYFNERVLERFADPTLFWKSRGVSDEIITEYDLRYSNMVMKPAPLKNGEKIDDDYYGPAAIIPHYWRGKLVGWQHRWMEDLRPKWVAKYTNTTDFPKHNTLYGYDNARRSKDKILVCESVITVLFLASCGIPAVSYFGGGIKPEQLHLLCSFDKGVILCPDNDAVGDKFLTEATPYLKRMIPVWHLPKVKLGPGADLGDFAKADNPLMRVHEHLLKAYRPEEVT